MEIVKDNISVITLKKMSEKMYNALVKAVVDIEQEVMAVDAEMHADQEEFLLEQGSEQMNLWGINIYPDKAFIDPTWIEFDSMINIRPSMGNRSRSIDDPMIREKIIKIVTRLVTQ